MWHANVVRHSASHYEIVITFTLLMPVACQLTDVLGCYGKSFTASNVARVHYFPHTEWYKSSNAYSPFEAIILVVPARVNGTIFYVQFIEPDQSSPHVLRPPLYGKLNLFSSFCRPLYCNSEKHWNLRNISRLDTDLNCSQTDFCFLFQS
jgi:hypothetical protein